MKARYFPARVPILLAMAGALTLPALASDYSTSPPGPQTNDRVYAPSFDESTGVQRGSGNPSPSSYKSHINDYRFQPDELKVTPKDGNVRILRTDQKALLNDYVTATIPVKNVDARELRNLMRVIVGLEGGRAESIKDKATGDQMIQVIAPSFMIPYLEKAIPQLDEKWVREYDNGAADVYYKAKNRDATAIDFIASNFASDSGFSVVDTTNNAVSRIDEPYRIENYLKGASMVDIPANQVLLEVKIVEIAANNDLKLGLDYINWKNGPGSNLWQFAFTGGIGETHNHAGEPSPFDVMPIGSVATGFANKVEQSFRARYASVNYLLTSNYIDFLQVKGQARVMTEESLMVKSANTATLRTDDATVAIVSNADEYTGVTPIASTRHDRDGNPLPDVPSPESSDRKLHNSDISDGSTGFFLSVTPFVGLESMELVIKICNSDLNGTAPNGQPIINARKLTTTVRLLDGEPYVISGLKRTHNVKESAKMPFLGSIPVLGYLFGGENDIKQQNDVLVVVTPHFYLASQPNIQSPKSVKSLADVVTMKTEVSLPAATVGYDQWLLDN